MKLSDISPRSWFSNICKNLQRKKKETIIFKFSHPFSQNRCFCAQPAGQWHFLTDPCSEHSNRGIIFQILSLAGRPQADSQPSGPMAKIGMRAPKQGRKIPNAGPQGRVSPVESGEGMKFGGIISSSLEKYTVNPRPPRLPCKPPSRNSPEGRVA